MEQQLIVDEFVAMTKKLIQQVMDEQEMGRIYPEFIREISKSSTTLDS